MGVELTVDFCILFRMSEPLARKRNQSEFGKKDENQYYHHQNHPSGSS
jgi:hypothetical protein